MKRYTLYIPSSGAVGSVAVKLIEKLKIDWVLINTNTPNGLAEYSLIADILDVKTESFPLLMEYNIETTERKYWQGLNVIYFLEGQRK
ncbi:MAG: hypothetical protein WC623_23990 [Pedobacter sp.]|uniref:hypothetical protein n=1 Tax=Pedobacter sp. TaxID=1411316 RepID=UPI0035675BC8